MDAAGVGFSNYPTMSSRYGDFARDAHHQQSSSAYSQQHVIETDYHAPPVGDFGYGRGGGVMDGYRDTFESWDGTGGGYSMNAMFADGGLQTDYELSNINSVSMTPNGKYAIVGQSQGPPQIWDAVNGQLVSSMQGTSANCSKVALACSGTLLVGLASDGVDAQPNVLQIWDVNTGKPVQLTHQIKCATFTLSNNSNNLIMTGNQKYGRGISVGILDLNNSELTKEIKSDTNQSYGGTPASITLTPDERYAIVGCPSGPSSTNYVVFDLTTQQELVQPPTITLDSDPKCSIVLNNEQVLTGTKNGQLVLWDIPTCQRLNTLNDNGQNAHRDRITDLKLSPDRSCLVSSSADGTAKVWDATTKELISKLIGHKREITCSCISTNQLVATGSKDQNICLWRLQTGQIASTMPVGMTPVDVHMAAHNRTIVAIGDKDGERQLLMLRVISVQR
jgi:WD40 repeat protein